MNLKSVSFMWKCIGRGILSSQETHLTQIMHMDRKLKFLNCISKRKSMQNMSFLHRVLTLLKIKILKFFGYVKDLAEMVACPTALIQLNSVTDKERSTHIHLSKWMSSTLNSRKEYFMLDKLCHCQIRLCRSLERFWKT